ncbi:hypothetical protein [Bradyrhizobium sp. AC87j1]|uniref:hypothetical protein n=1 Tax=Bradyrhizobium sp. AC87j1 TaxID=2055894 RepID=UPI0011B098AF|nr:hypothetical protein [Bradyrhizobium sp. AC87j1]
MVDQGLSLTGDGLCGRRQELPPVLRNFPAESIAKYKIRRKDIQIRRVYGQPRHAIGPVKGTRDLTSPRLIKPIRFCLHGPSEAHASA